MVEPICPNWDMNCYWIKLYNVHGEWRKKYDIGRIRAEKIELYYQRLREFKLKRILK